MLRPSAAPRCRIATSTLRAGRVCASAGLTQTCDVPRAPTARPDVRRNQRLVRIGGTSFPTYKRPRRCRGRVIAAEHLARAILFPLIRALSHLFWKSGDAMMAAVTTVGAIGSPAGL